MIDGALTGTGSIGADSSAAAGWPVLVEGLSWRPYGAPAPILDGLDLAIPAGQRVLLVGASGSGKSTLLHALAGVLTSTQSGDLTGRIVLGEHEQTTATGRAGLLVQDPADAVVAARVGRDVAFGPENAGLPRDTIWARVRQSLDAVHFPYDESRRTDALSGGEAQREALAGVLALHPGLLLLDEPCSMLDDAAATAVRAAALQAADRTGATLIVVEHRMGPWLDAVDRIVVLAGGRIVADGEPRAVLEAGREALLEAGLWLPGEPAPAPRAIDPDLVRPRSRVTVQAEALRLVRPPTTGLLSWLEPARPVLTVDEVSLAAGPGEVVALRGASGAGKSTVLRLLGGLLTPTGGSVRLQRGRPVESHAALPPADADQPAADTAETAETAGPGVVAAAPARDSARPSAAQVGWVAQDPELPIVGRTVLDEVMATGLALGQPVEALRHRAESLLAAVGLADRAGADPHRLSGGEQRRLAVVAAVAHGPGLLLLDEPTVGQDRATWAAVAGVIESAARAGTTVVAATHDDDLAALSTRVVPIAAPAIPDPPAEPAAARPGLAAHAGPLAILIAMIALAIGMTFVGSVREAGLIALAEFAFLLVCFVWRWPHPVHRLTPVAIGLASLWWSNWLLAADRDVAGAFVTAARVGLAVTPGVLLAACLEPQRLADALAQTLWLPARPVIAAAAALTRFDRLGSTATELMAIRRVRGLTPSGRGPVARGRAWATSLVALLVHTLRQATRMAVAMEARGYSLPVTTGRPRTWASAPRWALADTALVLLALALAALPIVLR